LIGFPRISSVQKFTFFFDLPLFNFSFVGCVGVLFFLFCIFGDIVLLFELASVFEAANYP